MLSRWRLSRFTYQRKNNLNWIKEQQIKSSSTYPWLKHWKPNFNEILRKILDQTDSIRTLDDVLAVLWLSIKLFLFLENSLSFLPAKQPEEEEEEEDNQHICSMRISIYIYTKRRRYLLMSRSYIKRIIKLSMKSHLCFFDKQNITTTIFKIHENSFKFLFLSFIIQQKKN